VSRTEHGRAPPSNREQSALPPDEPLRVAAILQRQIESVRGACQAGALLVMRILASSVPGWWIAVQPGRHDADAALTAFAAGLEDAVDLDSIRDDLATAVRQAGGRPCPGADQPAAEAHLCPSATSAGPVYGHAAHR
jgi:hypothetical protein